MVQRLQNPTCIWVGIVGPDGWGSRNGKYRAGFQPLGILSLYTRPDWPGWDRARLWRWTGMVGWVREVEFFRGRVDGRARAREEADSLRGMTDRKATARAEADATARTGLAFVVSHPSQVRDGWGTRHLWLGMGGQRQGQRQMQGQERGWLLCFPPLAQEQGRAEDGAPEHRWSWQESGLGLFQVHGFYWAHQDCVAEDSREDVGCRYCEGVGEGVGGLVDVSGEDWGADG